MRYTVDPGELVALWDEWHETSQRLLVARHRLPEADSVYLPGRSGVLDSAVDSLLAALRHCLGDAGQAAEQAGQSLVEAAEAYGRADQAFRAPGAGPIGPR